MSTYLICPDCNHHILPENISLDEFVCPHEMDVFEATDSLFPSHEFTISVSCPVCEFELTLESD